MGRSLTNTMVNLGIQSAVDEALYQVCGLGCRVNGGSGAGTATFPLM